MIESAEQMMGFHWPDSVGFRLKLLGCARILSGMLAALPTVYD